MPTPARHSRTWIVRPRTFTRLAPSALRAQWRTFARCSCGERRHPTHVYPSDAPRPRPAARLQLADALRGPCPAAGGPASRRTPAGP
eukprot:1701937-Alexandrium_andersonii.AAC.1